MPLFDDVVNGLRKSSHLPEEEPTWEVSQTARGGLSSKTRVALSGTRSSRLQGALWRWKRGINVWLAFVVANLHCLSLRNKTHYSSPHLLSLKCHVMKLDCCAIHLVKDDSWKEYFVSAVCHYQIQYFWDDNATSAQRHPRIQLIQERDRSATPLLLFGEQLSHVTASNTSLDESDERLMEGGKNVYELSSTVLRFHTWSTSLIAPWFGCTMDFRLR